MWRFLASLARPSRTVNARRLRERGESVDSFVIRDATVDDIPALARLHVETWNATYAPLLMKVPTVEIREAQWRQAFAESGPRWFCLVVEDGAGELIGFAQADRSDHPAYSGELRKIYLRREYQGFGLGRRLVAVVARRFLSEGIDSMWLFGDARNPSSAVWKALGESRRIPIQVQAITVGEICRNSPTSATAREREL